MFIGTRCSSHCSVTRRKSDISRGYDKMNWTKHDDGFCLADKDLFSGYINQILIFFQWIIYFYNLVEHEMFHFRLVE